MRTIIQVTNMEHTSAIEAYVGKKMESIAKLLKGREEAIARIEIGLENKHHKKGDVFFAELNLRLKGKELRSVEKASDLYAAIDAMKDEISSEIKAYLGKQKDERKKGGREAKAKMKKG